MKTVLLTITILALGYGTSLITENGSYSKYHNDSVDELLFSGGPPAAKTGAPGDGNCTDCHSGSTFSAAGVVTYNFSDMNDEYLPGNIYTIDLSIASGAKNGFQMTILDGSDNAAGTFTAGTNSTTSSSGGREYINHNASSGVTSWSFDWNAPATDMGNLTVYYAFNKTNNAGNSAGDSVFLGQETINISAQAGLSDYQQLEEDFSVWYNDQNQEINVKYKPLAGSNVLMHVYDLSGKLVYGKDIGKKNANVQKEKIDVSGINTSGLFIVSVLIDNYVLNEKVYIK